METGIICHGLATLNAMWIDLQAYTFSNFLSFTLPTFLPPQLSLNFLQRENDNANSWQNPRVIMVHYR